LYQHICADLTGAQQRAYSRGGQSAARGPHEALELDFAALEPFFICKKHFKNQINAKKSGFFSQLASKMIT
jgi:hypothetical protein